MRKRGHAHEIKWIGIYARRVCRKESEASYVGALYGDSAYASVGMRAACLHGQRMVCGSGGRSVCTAYCSAFFRRKKRLTAVRHGGARVICREGAAVRNRSAVCSRVCAESGFSAFQPSDPSKKGRRSVFRKKLSAAIDFFVEKRYTVYGLVFRN